MCGIVGFFTGCQPADCSNPSISICPFRGAARRDAFATWDEKASVRGTPRRVLSNNGPAQTMFPKKYAPVCNHSLIEEKYPHLVNQLLTYHMYRYMTFTINLELKVVNRSTRKIVEGTLPFQVSEQDRLNAFRLYCDEGYHALFSADILQQAIDLTGTAAPQNPEPSFLGSLRLHCGIPEERNLLELVFTIVSETLITSNLSQVHRAGEMPEAIKDVIRDHALDEARHHIYYRDLFFQLWVNLTPREKERIAGIIPHFIMAFIRPDTTAIMNELLQAGVSSKDAQSILEETYTNKVISDYATKSASQMMSYCREVGILDYGKARDSFGLVGIDCSSAS